MQNWSCPLVLWNCTSSVPVGPCVPHDSEETQIFSVILVFFRIKYFKHRISDELLYAAHTEIPKSGIFKIHLCLKGDTGLTGRPGPIGPPGVGEPGLLVCLFLIWWEGSRTERKKLWCFSIKRNVCVLNNTISFISSTSSHSHIYYIVWLSFLSINRECFQLFNFSNYLCLQNRYEKITLYAKPHKYLYKSVCW